MKNPSKLSFRAKTQKGSLLQGRGSKKRSLYRAKKITVVSSGSRTSCLSRRRMRGQTLSYDDEKEQGRARHAANSALNRLFEGDDSLSPMIDYVHHSREAKMQTKQMRLLRTPPEILSMPSDQQIIHADGLPHPIEADRKHYTEQRFMAGRFHPNRYYPPLDRVRVKTRFGHAWRRVIEEPVPPEFAHLSQYAGGTWTRIEKRKWWQIWQI